MSLVELRIRNLAVFHEAVVPIPAGFVALTGETGAGKSVCIAALRLALGDRIEGDPLTPGADSARLSAVFDDVPVAMRERLAGIGVPPDELLTLTREISRAGRGSCRVNGALVSQAVLREVGDTLAEVTVQGASQRLLQRARQRDILDLAAGSAEPREAVRTAVGWWRAADARVDDLRRLHASGAAEVEAARRTIEDLTPLRLVPGEDTALASERLRLRNAAALLDATAGLHRAASGSEDSGGAADLVAAAAEAGGRLSGVDPGLDELTGQAWQLAEQLRDLGSAARQRADAVGMDEARLAEVEERLDVVARVRRRHGSIEDALVAMAAAQDLLDASTGGEGGLETAIAAAAAARASAGAVALRLSLLRRAAARRLEAEVEAALRLLELPHARFRIVLQQRPDPLGVEAEGATVWCGPAGIDDVEFQLATNRGTAPAALDAGPSGGELSRLVLALSACVSESGSPLLVLDEVDTGLGGETAARVGDLLAAAGRHRQVVAVTHRAEIASRADHHLLVRKSETAGGVAAAADEVDGSARMEEIARLMSGRVTEAALARAVELRGEAVATISAPAGGAPAPHRPPGATRRSRGR
jgi:DNA repair protein RecN (Recombination protein N)